jgi:hypothetical protein
MNSCYEEYEKFRNSRITIDELSDIESTITNECRWYLLGKLCFDESARDIELTRPEIFEKLRPAFGLTDSSYRRLMTYKTAIDRLQQLVPELMPRIIEGNARLSVENAITASRWEPDYIRAALEKLRDRTVNINTVFAEHLSHRNGIRQHKRNGVPEHKQTVKDTPAFDPEAQISGICYTIPSWVTAIDRAFTATEFADVSQNARYKFVKELTVLQDTAHVVLEMLKESK